MLVTMLSPFLTVSPVLPMTCARVVLCDIRCLGVVSGCVCVQGMKQVWRYEKMKVVEVVEVVEVVDVSLHPCESLWPETCYCYSYEYNEE